MAESLLYRVEATLEVVELGDLGIDGLPLLLSLLKGEASGDKTGRISGHSNDLVRFLGPRDLRILRT